MEHRLEGIFGELAIVSAGLSQPTNKACFGSYLKLTIAHSDVVSYYPLPPIFFYPFVGPNGAFGEAI